MTTHRERILGQARADLTALPDLYAELARTLTERHHDVSGYAGKIAGSPAPLSIPVVHLADDRHKPGWWGEDPRQPRWSLTWSTRTSLHVTEGAAWRAFHQQSRLPAPLELHQWAAVRVARYHARDQYGIGPTLEGWVRILWEEMWEQLNDFPDLTEHATVRSESATLVEHWGFIEGQQWATELAEDVTRLAQTVRAALGQKPELKFKCPQCGNPAYMQPGGILACTEVPDHDLVVRDLEKQMRRRPALPTKDICEEFGLEISTLRVWKHRRKISTAPGSNGHRRDMWFPWDVFCLLNPEIAEAFATRDELDASTS